MEANGRRSPGKDAVAIKMIRECHERTMKAMAKKSFTAVESRTRPVASMSERGDCDPTVQERVKGRSRQLQRNMPVINGFMNLDKSNGIAVTGMQRTNENPK